MSNRDVNQAFADWLRREMRQRGWDPDGPRAGGRTHLASVSGLSLSVISRVLNEGRTPDVESLRMLGRALGYSLGDMLVAAGRATADELPVSPEAPVGSGVDPALLADAEHLDPAEVQRVRDFIRGIKAR